MGQDRVFTRMRPDLLAGMPPLEVGREQGEYTQADVADQRDGPAAVDTGDTEPRPGHPHTCERRAELDESLTAIGAGTVPACLACLT